jgi:hypothetical protein
MSTYSNISIVGPTVQFARRENRFVGQGVSFTVDFFKNPWLHHHFHHQQAWGLEWHGFFPLTPPFAPQTGHLGLIENVVVLDSFGQCVLACCSSSIDQQLGEGYYSLSLGPWAQKRRQKVQQQDEKEFGEIGKC